MHICCYVIILSKEFVCPPFKALVFADANAIKQNSMKLGAGEDLYVLFAGILTMRPWNRVIDPAADQLVIKGNDSDRSELQLVLPFANHLFLLLWNRDNIDNIQILTDFPELIGRLPNFHNLRYMVLSDWFSGSYIHAAVNFLGRFPHIETLAWERLDQIDMNPETEEEYWIDNMPLQSIFDYVKIFEIGELRMCTDALAFLEVLLKRAIVLKKLIIKRVTRKRYGMDMEEFKRKLVELLRASSGVSFLLFGE